MEIPDQLTPNRANVDAQASQTHDSQADAETCPTAQQGHANWEFHGIGASYFAELKAANAYTYWNGA